MTDVSRILQRVEDDDSEAIRDLFSAVYDELRKIAARHLQNEEPGQTLQATALVHEAWLKLMAPLEGFSKSEVSDNSLGLEMSDHQWKSRAHFFGAAAEAMRRILVDNARKRNRLKRGGDLKRTMLDLDAVSETPDDNLLEVLDEALQRFAAVDAVACELVKLRYFAGLSLLDAGKVLNIAPRSADRLWAYAKAWLLREIQ
ncbi:MAG: sigma-70 family RNA polymerase sigma factor [Planctomycetaceae bacterium]